MRRLARLLERTEDAAGTPRERLLAVLNQEQPIEILKKGDWKKLIADSIAEKLAEVAGVPRASVSVDVSDAHLGEDEGKITVGAEFRTREVWARWGTASGPFKARVDSVAIEGEFGAETETVGDEYEDDLKDLKWHTGEFYIEGVEGGA